MGRDGGTDSMAAPAGRGEAADGGADCEAMRRVRGAGSQGGVGGAIAMRVRQVLELLCSVCVSVRRMAAAPSTRHASVSPSVRQSARNSPADAPRSTSLATRSCGASWGAGGSTADCALLTRCSLPACTHFLPPWLVRLLQRRIDVPKKKTNRKKATAQPTSRQPRDPPAASSTCTEPLRQSHIDGDRRRTPMLVRLQPPRHIRPSVITARWNQKEKKIGRQFFSSAAVPSPR